jgi:hypothetical protein
VATAQDRILWREHSLPLLGTESQSPDDPVRGSLATVAILGHITQSVAVLLWCAVYSVYSEVFIRHQIYVTP